VHPYTAVSDPDVILGSVFGEDAAFTRVGDHVLVSHVDPVVGAIANIGWLAVHVAGNDVATSGVRPRWILLLILVPHAEDEGLLERIMRDCSSAAREMNASIIGGHTGYSSGISRPLVAATVLGVTAGRRLIRTAGARVGDHVLVTKGIALEGTSILAEDFAGTARELGLSKEDLAAARDLIKEGSEVPEALVLADHGVSSMHDATRGGLLETLLEVAYLARAAIEIDASLIPARPVVGRFAKAFRFDPLRMISSGTLVGTVPPDRVGSAGRALAERRIPFADVGRVVKGKGVKVEGRGRIEIYRDMHAEEDELARLWTRYRPDEPE